jgi:arabinofuranosyltransferase
MSYAQDLDCFSQASARHPKRKFRIYFLVFISCVIAALLWRNYLTLAETPAEDAAMLLHYSLNLAQGYGIVWNVGSKPVDGATDFLPMVAIAALIRAGLGPMAAVQILGITCHFLTALLIFWALTHLEGAGILAASISALYFFCGPGLLLISAGFATPVFALVCAMTWYLALTLILQEGTRLNELGFVLSALGLGLTRPEGVILAVLMLLSIVSAKGGLNSFRLMTYFLIAFTVLGGGYFLWHWRYFGHLMPLPFYRKGGWHLYPASLTESVYGTSALAGPFIFAYLLGFRKPDTLRLTLIASVPILGFTAVWLFLSDEMNFMMRFQYPLLPVILMSWYPLVKDLAGEIQSSRLIALRGRQRGLALWAAQLGLCLYVLSNARQLDMNGQAFHNSNYDVAVVLSQFNHRYVVATT